ncbi:MAG TPA: CopG family transcriptional regulator [Candidatus Solibacter sp.]|nr:CopG family transcriptional regulator [Candidatus Solibacter sp.]
MKRTQLYLNEDMWKALHIRSRQQKTTVSELVREAVREKYGSSAGDRRRAMQAMVGIWKDREDLPDSEQYVRQLRRGKRLRRIKA